MNDGLVVLSRQKNRSSSIFITVGFIIFLKGSDFPADAIVSIVNPQNKERKRSINKPMMLFDQCFCDDSFGLLTR